MRKPGKSVCIVIHRNAKSKERAIQRRFSERFEQELKHIADSLTKKGRVKNYEKILLRIGRLKQRYSRVVRFYEIHVHKDEATGNAKAIHWSRITAEEKTHLGVYCLRTNEVNWDEQTLWRTCPPCLPIWRRCFAH